MRNKAIIRILLFGCFLCCSGVASALQAITGHVTSVEPTYLPSKVTFQLDAGNNTCPAGTWLGWQNANIDNNKVVYATLAAALTTGKTVTFFMNDGDASCSGQYLHLNYI